MLRVVHATPLLRYSHGCRFFTSLPSYVHGTSHLPLIGETIGTHLSRVSEKYADHDALIVRHQGIRWDYRTFLNKVNQVADGLLALNLNPGDRVGLWSPNNAEWTVAQFATAMVGLVLVNVNPAYRLNELTHCLNAVGAKALITAHQFKSSQYTQMLESIIPTLNTSAPGELRSPKLPDLRIVIQIANHIKTPPSSFHPSTPYDDMGPLPFQWLASHDIDYSRLSTVANSLSFDDPINIQFTSGTTGQPKGATLTHHNVLNNGFFVGERMNYSPKDKVCIPVPLYHCFGMVLGNLACVTHGAAMVFPSESFNATDVLQTVSEEQCTSLYGVPTMFLQMLDHEQFNTFDLRSLRTGIMAGSICPAAIMDRVVHQMHMKELTICYGMTETSPVSFQTTIDDPIERRLHSVGQIHPHVEVKIINNGQIVPRGEPGELCTRGYSVMQGYWGNEEATRETIDDAGWLHTGDLARMDDQGYVEIVGRKKDMIIRGGENIFPKEIEDFLYTHPKIQDVHVIGVPDTKYGEELCAWVKLKDHTTSDEIKSFCTAQLAYFKVPRYIRIVNQFPLTVTGKVQKFMMREIEEARLNHEHVPDEFQEINTR